MNRSNAIIMEIPQILNLPKDVSQGDVIELKESNFGEILVEGAVGHGRGRVAVLHVIAVNLDHILLGELGLMQHLRERCGGIALALTR